MNMAEMPDATDFYLEVDEADEALMGDTYIDDGEDHETAALVQLLVVVWILDHPIPIRTSPESRQRAATI